MVTRWGLGDGSIAPAGRIILSSNPGPTSGAQACEPDNNCGCGPPPFCNKWVLYFFQSCEDGGGEDGSVFDSADGSQHYTMAATIFVDLSSIPTEVANPPPQVAHWDPTYGTTRSVTVPGVTTTAFVLLDSAPCPMGTGVVDPFAYGCDRKAVLSNPDMVGGRPSDCTVLKLTGGQPLCDPKAVHNVPSAPTTSIVLPATQVTVGSNGLVLSPIVPKTVNVVDTTGFPSSGTFTIPPNLVVNYTGKSGAAFTGCTSLITTPLATGDVATARVLIGSSEIPVGDTTGYPSSGTFYLNTGGPAWLAITYTGISGNDFTGCVAPGGFFQLETGYVVNGIGSGAIDPACPDPRPSGLQASFFSAYLRVSGSDCHLDEATLVDLYSIY